MDNTFIFINRIDIIFINKLYNQRTNKMNQEERIMEDSVEETPGDNTDWKDMYLRLFADMDNLRKRIFKEKEELTFKTKAMMIEPILNIDSNLAIAAKHSTDNGIKLILSELESFLTSQGIEVIQTHTYDENIHEVISVVEFEDKGIIDVISKGYKIGDKIIRYPKVIISK